MESLSRLECQQVGKWFRNEPVLRHVSLEARAGEFLTVLGPSGCGKTTLLRLLAGCLQPDEGRIIRAVEGDGQPTRLLLVPQTDSLLPWMTALDNACFGLRMQGVGRAEREAAAGELFSRLGLEGHERAYPYQLSQGMRQRVAVIRAFLGRPSILLMDEPFAALDALSRMRLQEELLALWAQRAGTGVVFVTHEVEEAILLSDRILIFSARPGTVVAELAVELSRPRGAAATVDPAFVALKARILAELGVVTGACRHA